MLVISLRADDKSRTDTNTTPTLAPRLVPFAGNFNNKKNGSFGQLHDPHSPN